MGTVRHLLVLLLLAGSVWAEEPGTDAPGAPEPPPEWHYSAFLDVNYAVNFNFPENHRWRSRTTTPRNNEFSPDMALAYIRKDLTARSNWGMEFGVQGGYDSRAFAFGNDRPLVGGADTLRHFAYANLSSLVPAGSGVTLTGGLFDSLIGFESLYARDNFNYSRSWIADNSPYKMFGVKARYALRDDLVITPFIINGYWHLAHPNDLPSYGTQLHWKPTSTLSVKEAVYYGPDQTNTALRFWRLFFDTIAEWKRGTISLTFEHQIGTEEMVELPSHPRTFWTGAALFTQWDIEGPWSVGVRPEFFWDRNGRQSGFQQFVKAVTSTLAYKWAPSPYTVLFKLEHRYDESTGAQGGFLKGRDASLGVPGLTPGQHLLFLSAVWSFDSP